jgi:peptidoglycan hydrolase-like protein with peptidoglycan-binding domain
MKYGDRGPEVLELQEALIEEGHELPKYGPDGDFGGETLSALNAFEKAQDWPLTRTDCDVCQETLDDLQWDVPEDPEVPKVPSSHFATTKLYDLRSESWSERNQKKFKRQAGKPVVRDPSQVTGITIHQTAAKYGVVDYQVHDAGGDRQLALARRSLRVACHVMAFHDGFVAWPNDLRHYVYHGNGFNSFELGFEIDGNYPGVIGGRTWNKRTPTKVTPKLLEAACAGIELLVIEGRKLGMPIEYIHAHRQSSGKRRDDPGEELWAKVVLGFAVPALGLKLEQGRVLKDGRPIPKDWDLGGHGKY